jgi:hypothetical protein
LSRLIAVAMVLALTGAGVPAAGLAAEQKPEPGPAERAEQAIKQGAEQLMRALELMLRAVPQYEMPELNERGDIIIRRKNPPPNKPAPPGKDKPAPPDETNT